MSVDLVPGLSDEYLRLWSSCTIRPERVQELDLICSLLLAHRDRYEAAGAPLGVPWHFVAAIHQMEASGRFNCHLHNGDPLTDRTVQVPAGRPLTGDPPFTWEASAQDALALKRLDQWHDWTVAGILYRLEGYNGFGYRLHHPECPSPYLWSYTTIYTSGKYVADGKWDAEAVSKQPGAAAILKRLHERGVVTMT